MTTYKPKKALEPLSPDEISSFSFDDYKAMEDRKRDWQIMPPVATTGRLAAVQVNNNPLASDRDPRNQEAYNIQTAPPAVIPQENPPLCRVSFVGPDQQWYSIKIGSSGSAQAASPALPPAAPMMQAQAVPALPSPAMQPQTAQAPSWQQQAAPMMQAQTAQSPSWQQAAPMMQAQIAQTPPWQQAAPMMQAQPALHPGWGNEAPGTATLGEPNMRTSEWAPAPAAEPEGKMSSKEFILQIVQPGLTGLMDGSVSTLAPIFAVAFATHNSFTTFLIGLASALGAGISMAFSEALSDDGELTGRGKPFLRGGVTGLMTFLSGMGHALPFLIPNLQVALIMAYVVVAVELVAIAAIRHKFFGTGWLLSMIQVVGGGALVFVVALLLGNA